MRKSLFILMLFPVVVFAQSHPGVPPNMPMDHEKIQRMQKMQRQMQQMDMGKMQEAMACMENIDQSALKVLDAEGQKMKSEVEALCKSGRRAAAQDKAMEYAKDMMSRPEMKKIRECSKLAAGMMPKMTFEDLVEDGKNRHVCDDFRR